MLEQNNVNNSNNVLKIVLAAVIGFLSLILLAVGIIYILSVQNKISELENEQQEELKKQLETRNMASVQTVPQSQPQQVQQQSQPVKKEVKRTQNTEISEPPKPVIFYVDATGDEDGIVSVRLEPNEESELIDDLSHGESVEYLGRKGDWYYVRYSGGKGYIHKSKLIR